MEVAASRQGDGLVEWLPLLRRGDTRLCESFAPFRAAVVVESCAIGGTGRGAEPAQLSSKQNTKTATR